MTILYGDFKIFWFFVNVQSIFFQVLYSGSDVASCTKSWPQLSGFFLFSWDGVPKRMAKKKQCQQPQETIKLARHNEESYDQQDSWISVFMCCCLNGIGIEGEPWTMAS